MPKQPVHNKGNHKQHVAKPKHVEPKKQANKVDLKQDKISCPKGSKKDVKHVKDTSKDIANKDSKEKDVKGTKEKESKELGGGPAKISQSVEIVGKIVDQFNKGSPTAATQSVEKLACKRGKKKKDLAEIQQRERMQKIAADFSRTASAKVLGQDFKIGLYGAVFIPPCPPNLIGNSTDGSGNEDDETASTSGDM